MMNNHRDNQKQSEREVIKVIIPALMEALHLSEKEFPERIKETEEPDFIVQNGDMEIGVEVIECHPSASSKKKKDNAPALANFKKKICEQFEKNLYLNHITQGYNNKLIISIEYSSLLSTKYSIESICTSLEYYLIAYHEGMKVNKGRIIRGLRINNTKGSNIIRFNSIGRVDAIQCSEIIKCIEKKNSLFETYKSKNGSCSEFWLCIHLPWEEYKCSYMIDYDVPGNRLAKILKKSPFSRICVTSSLHNDIRWLKGYSTIHKQTQKKKSVKKYARCIHTNEGMNLKRYKAIMNYHLPKIDN